MLDALMKIAIIIGVVSVVIIKTETNANFADKLIHVARTKDNVFPPMHSQPIFTNVILVVACKLHLLIVIIQTMFLN